MLETEVMAHRGRVGIDAPQTTNPFHLCPCQSRKLSYMRLSWQHTQTVLTMQRHWAYKKKTKPRTCSKLSIQNFYKKDNTFR